MKVVMKADPNSERSGNGQHSRTPPSTDDPSAPKADDGSEQTGTTDPDTLRQLLKQIHELGEYFSYYLAARTDSLKLGFWRIGLTIALGALAFVSVAGLVITASCFVLRGLAGGLGVLFGDRSWLGNLLAGMLLLVGLSGGMIYAVARRARAARGRTVEKYAKRRAQQQTRFGRSVSDGRAVTSSEK